MVSDNDRILQMEGDLLKVLAHPTRLRILGLLQEGEHCVCDITADLELEQANVSQHLTVLKRQDLVSSRKEGLKVMYRVNYPETYALLEACRRLLRAQARAAAAVLDEEERQTE